MELIIRPLLPEERLYTYSQSQQLRSQTGSIGHLRGDFGKSGSEFFTAWNDHATRYKTDDFKAEFDDVFNTLRTGMLDTRKSMTAYCCEHPDSGFDGNYCKEYGFRADTGKYAYLIRCNPNQGDYNFYIFPFVAEWLDKHIDKARQGIRFIDPHYKELFKIKDGGSIIITRQDGEQIKRACRFIDEYHTEVGSELYHICQFAEIIERNGSTYAPAEPSDKGSQYVKPKNREQIR